MSCWGSDLIIDLYKQYIEYIHVNHLVAMFELSASDRQKQFKMWSVVIVSYSVYFGSALKSVWLSDPTVKPL